MSVKDRACVAEFPAANESEGPDLQGQRARRDGFGWLCFALHLALVVFAFLGWLLPWRSALVFYLCYIPAMFVTWQFNDGSCVLNNVENLIRSGKWRNPANREEGAFLKTLVEDVTGLQPTKRQMNTVIYCLISVFWLLGAGHLAWQSQP